MGAGGAGVVIVSLDRHPLENSDFLSLTVVRPLWRLAPVYEHGPTGGCVGASGCRRLDECICFAAERQCRTEHGRAGVAATGTAAAAIDGQWWSVSARECRVLP